MKNILSAILAVFTVCAGVQAQMPQQTPIADETLRLCVTGVQARQFGAAVADCGKAIAKAPAKPDAYQWRGVAHANLKNLDAAIADFSKMVQVAPNNAEGYSLRSEVYLAQLKYDLALADVNKVLQLVPNNIGALYRRAVIFSNTDKKALAVADLKAVLAINPNLPDIKAGLARLEADLKPFVFEGRPLSTPAAFVKEAEVVFFKSGAYAGMVLQNQDRDRYFVLLSNCVARFPNDYDCAKKTIEFYESETTKDIGYNPGGLNPRTKFDGSQPAKWIESNFVPLYTAILKKEPNNLNAYSRRGQTHLNNRSYDAAAADYTKIIELDAKKFYLYYGQRAKAYRGLKKYDAALADVDEALARAPEGFWKTMYEEERLNIQLEAQRYDAVIAESDRLLAKDPKNANARITRGIVFRTQGKNDLAIAEFSAGIRDNPNFEPLYRERAATYRLAGKPDLAAADERKAQMLKTGK